VGIRTLIVPELDVNSSRYRIVNCLAGEVNSSQSGGESQILKSMAACN
jgi:hypothetical protein